MKPVICLIELLDPFESVFVFKWILISSREETVRRFGVGREFFHFIDSPGIVINIIFEFWIDCVDFFVDILFVDEWFFEELAEHIDALCETVVLDTVVIGGFILVGAGIVPASVFFDELGVLSDFWEFLRSLKLTLRMIWYISEKRGIRIGKREFVEDD